MVLERSGVGLQEQRLHTQVKGWVVSGQYDYLDGDGIIWDWKTASVREIDQGVKDSREQQLNCYAHLASANGIEVKGLRVGFILRDWSKIQAKTQAGYPPHQVMVYPIPLWEPTARQAFMEERVKLHQEARLAFHDCSRDHPEQDIYHPPVALPECTDEERWATPETYAVIKKGNKRASKLFTDSTDAVLDANTRGKDYAVQVRKGQSIRCEYYCGVSSVCVQWQTLKTV